MTRRVVDLVRDRVRIEAGSASVPSSLERCAIVVHFSESTRLTASVLTLVSELHANGYLVVISSSCEADGDLEWPDGIPADTVVIRKPNLGYDFGSAAVALDRFPQIAAAPYVLVVNDSNAGPFGPLASSVAHFESSPAQAWGLTGSYQYGFHLQSFFLGFRDGILRDRPLRDFWRGIEQIDDKKEIIRRYEIGLSTLLASEGYVLDHRYGGAEFASPRSRMPAVHLWRELVAAGYPLLKRKLADTELVEARRPVTATMRQEFGIEVDQWL